MLEDLEELAVSGEHFDADANALRVLLQDDRTVVDPRQDFGPQLAAIEGIEDGKASKARWRPDTRRQGLARDRELQRLGASLEVVRRSDDHARRRWNADRAGELQRAGLVANDLHLVERLGGQGRQGSQPVEVFGDWNDRQVRDWNDQTAAIASQRFFQPFDEGGRGVSGVRIRDACAREAAPERDGVLARGARRHGHAGPAEPSNDVERRDLVPVEN